MAGFNQLNQMIVFTPSGETPRELKHTHTASQPASSSQQTIKPPTITPTALSLCVPFLSFAALCGRDHDTDYLKAALVIK
jgi:hypothetical protein